MGETAKKREANDVEVRVKKGKKEKKEVEVEVAAAKEKKRKREGGDVEAGAKKAKEEWMDALPQVPQKVKDALVEAGIDAEFFVLMEDADLMELGVGMGPRKLLRKTIADWQVNGIPSARATATPAKSPAAECSEAINGTAATEATKGAAKDEADVDGEVQPDPLEGHYPRGTVVEFRWPNTGIDESWVSGALGHGIAMQLAYLEPIRFAYDSTGAFRNLVCLRFLTSAAAAKAYMQLIRMRPVGDTESTTKLTTTKTPAVRARMLKSIPVAYRQREVNGEKGKGGKKEVEVEVAAAKEKKRKRQGGDVEAGAKKAKEEKKEAAAGEKRKREGGAEGGQREKKQKTEEDEKGTPEAPRKKKSDAEIRAEMLRDGHLFRFTLPTGLKGADKQSWRTMEEKGMVLEKRGCLIPYSQYTQGNSKSLRGPQRAATAFKADFDALFPDLLQGEALGLDTAKKRGFVDKTTATHLCHNRDCVRPDHVVFEPRWMSMRRTFCGLSGKCDCPPYFVRRCVHPFDKNMPPSPFCPVTDECEAKKMLEDSCPIQFTILPRDHFDEEDAKRKKRNENKRSKVAQD